MLFIFAKVQYNGAWVYLLEYAEKHPFNEDGQGIYYLKLFGRPEAISLIESFRSRAGTKSPVVTRLHLEAIEDAVDALRD